MAERPSYFSILTADVRYDPRLKSYADCKILYSEITALSNKTGYCHASNSYFAKLYDRPVPTISRWINILKKLGYLHVQMIKDGKQIKERRIYPISTPINADVNTPSQQREEGYSQQYEEGINAGVKENNTSINNTSKNSNICSSTAKPTSFNSQCREIVEYLNKKTGKSFKLNAKGNRSAIIPRLKEGYTVDQLKKVIDNKVTDWKGVTFSNGQPGDNYLTPATLFRSSKIEGYLNEVHKPSKPSGVETDQERIKRLAAQYPS